MSLADIQAMKALKTANKAAKTRNFGYNLDNGLRIFRAGVADIDSNPVKIAVVGDSIAFGAYSSDILNTNWVSRLRKILQTKLGDVGVGNYPIPSDTTPTQLALSPWTLTGTWTVTTYGSIFGRWMSATGTANSTTLTFNGTSVDLIYHRGTSGASSGVSITIDGVAQTAPNFYGAASTVGDIQSYTGFSAGNHTLVITAPATGYIYIEGLIAYNTPAGTAKGCYVFNMSNPGARTDYFVNNTAKMTIATKNPHLYIIALGVNDARLAPTSYYDNLKKMIQDFQSFNGSVVLLPYCISDTTQNLANYTVVMQQQYQLANELNCGLIDIFARWNTYLEAKNIGYMGGTLYDGTNGTDIYHPSNKGHRDIANAISMHLIGQLS